MPSAVVRQLERQLCAQDAKIGELAASARAASEAHADASAALEALQAAIEAEKVCLGISPQSPSISLLSLASWISPISLHLPPSPMAGGHRHRAAAS